MAGLAANVARTELVNTWLRCVAMLILVMPALTARTSSCARLLRPGAHPRAVYAVLATPQHGGARFPTLAAGFHSCSRIVLGRLVQSPLTRPVRAHTLVGHGKEVVQRMNDFWTCEVTAS